MRFGIRIAQRAPDGHVGLSRLAVGWVDAVCFAVHTPAACYWLRHPLKDTIGVVELALDQIKRNSSAVS